MPVRLTAAGTVAPFPLPTDVATQEAGLDAGFTGAMDDGPRVPRFLDRKDIKALYHRVEKDSDNVGRVFVHFRWR